MMRTLTCSIALLIGLIATPAAARPIEVTFINPGRSDEPYWRSVTRFMQPAAAQLDIHLEVLYAERDHVQMIALAQQIADRVHKPDYLIIVNEKLAGGEMLRLADHAKINTLLAFGTFEAQQAADFGTPRKRFPYWLGAIGIDAVEGGRETARELIAQARRTGLRAADGQLHVVMIGGDKATVSGVQRVTGAAAAFADDPGVTVDQVVYANWERSRAKEQTAALLQRYPDLQAIWTASDLTAFGAIDALQGGTRRAGKEILLATINNSPAVLRARIDGQVSALAGGHFTAGAWALVMLYDYHHGKDFASEALVLRPQLFNLIDAAQAQSLLSRFGDEDFSSIDFRKFSKVLSPALKRYQFGLLPALR